MSESLEPKSIGSMLPVISRRDFIKGVIVGGAAVSSAGYLFRASTLLAQSPVVSGRLITINVNGQTAARRRDEAGDAGHDAALQTRPDRHKDRLRPGRMRRVHRAD